MAVVSVCLTEDAELLIIDDGRVVCVDHDNLEELVLTVFADPVGVENLKVWEVACDTLFCNALRVLCHCNLGNTSLGWLTLHVNLSLAESTTADTGANQDNALLGFVSQASSSIETCRTLNSAVNRLAAPLCHSSLTEHVRESLFRLLPGFTNIVMESFCHSNTSMGASCRL